MMETETREECSTNEDCCEPCECEQGNTRAPQITLLVGLPRSGKTTYRNKNRWRGVIISADDIRYKVYGQRFFGDGEPLMWSIRDIMLKTLLEQGVDIIIDETNTTKKRRQPIIELAKKHGYFVDCVWVKTPKEICLKRAELENDEYIAPVIERMAEQFEAPEKEEGINWITILE